MKSIEIALKNIVPDENQPRRYFNAEKMKMLKNSIKSYGIMTPLIVQEIGKGQYLLVDGERRFRAAKELDLKEVPAVVEKAQNDTERLVRQFNVQEQHEAWTPTEKAVAIEKLSQHLGVTVPEACKLLNVSVGDTSRYIAYANIIDKTSWLKSEMPLDIANGVSSLKSKVKHIMENELETEFTRKDAQKIEARVIQLVKDNAVTGRGDLTKLGDAFKANPKTIQQFFTTNATPTELFLKSKAKGAYHIRNVWIHAGWVASHGDAFLKLRDVKITPEQVTIFKRAQKILGELIDLAE